MAPKVIQKQKQTIWRPIEWRAAAKISSKTLKRLPPEYQPKGIVVRMQQRYVEDPYDWLVRVGQPKYPGDSGGRP